LYDSNVYNPNKTSFVVNLILKNLSETLFLVDFDNDITEQFTKIHYFDFVMLFRVAEFALNVVAVCDV